MLCVMNIMHLLKNKTWTLVPRPADTNIVRCMWLFRHKYLADRTLSHNKARIVANGSTQVTVIDVDETFSPVVKPGTIWTVLSLADSRHWLIHQLDVNNAFLHGDLFETVYMHQPLGFHDSAHPDYVCLLERLQGIHGCGHADWPVDNHQIYFPESYSIIMEYLVNISKRRAFWSLNEDILKINILTTNTPYPSRKIRRICACTHQRPQGNKSITPYERSSIIRRIDRYEQSFMEDIKRGPLHIRNYNTSYPIP
ncbi:ribonuclease H-like domain-containing protein [Tanacetum coccineum]